MSKQKKYHVGLYYQTPTGKAGAKNFRVAAKNETEAEKKARKLFMQGKAGKGYKIQGGDVMEIK